MTGRPSQLKLSYGELVGLWIDGGVAAEVDQDATVLQALARSRQLTDIKLDRLATSA